MQEGIKKSSVAFLAGTIVGFQGIRPLMHIFYWAMIVASFLIGKHLGGF